MYFFLNLLFFFTLKYCIGFAIHQHESANVCFDFIATLRITKVFNTWYLNEWIYIEHEKILKANDAIKTPRFFPLESLKF